jgi:fructokinase
MIVCCGESLIDMVPFEGRPDAFLVRPGGCPYNTAIAAARLGASVAFLGRVGTDFLADTLVDRLREAAVDTSLVIRRDEPTTLAFVQRSASGDARYAFYSENAADRSLEERDLPARLPASARFLVAGSISLALEPAASTIEAFARRAASQALLSLDPNLRPSLAQDRASYQGRLERMIALSAIVKASEEDLEWLFPGLGADAAAERLLGMGPELIAITRGGSGSTVRTRAASVSAPAMAVKVVDTIGAGDTFHAGLLVALEEAGVCSREALNALDEKALDALLRFASAAAALDCARAGAEPPTRAELAAFLESRG